MLKFLYIKEIFSKNVDADRRRQGDGGGDCPADQSTTQRGSGRVTNKISKKNKLIEK